MNPVRYKCGDRALPAFFFNFPPFSKLLLPYDRGEARIYCLGGGLQPRVMASAIGVWGGYAPSGIQEQSPWSEGQGQSPLKLKAILELSEQHCAL